MRFTGPPELYRRQGARRVAWHRLKHKRTGEVQVVASLDGYDLDKFDAVPIRANRAPTEFQVVNDDGTMTTDEDAKARAVQAAKLRAEEAGLSDEERLALRVRRELERLGVTRPDKESSVAN